MKTELETKSTRENQHPNPNRQQLEAQLTNYINDPELTNAIASKNLSSHELEELIKVLSLPQANPSLKEISNIPQIAELKSLSQSDFTQRVSLLSRKEQIFLLASINENQFRDLSTHQQEFLNSLEESDIRFQIEVKDTSFQLAKNILDSKTRMLEMNLKDSKQAFDNSFLPSFLSNHTRSKELETSAYRLLLHSYQAVIKDLTSNHIESASHLKIANFLNTLSADPLNIDKKEDLQNLASRFLKSAKNSIDLETCTKTYQDRLTQAKELLHDANKSQTQSLQNWDIAEKTTLYTRDALFTSACYVAGMAFAPLMFGVFGSTIIGLSMNFLTCLIVGKTFGYTAGYFSAYLENRFGGQNKDIALEAESLSYRCSASAVGGGVFGVLTKFVLPVAQASQYTTPMMKLFPTYFSGGAAGMAEGLIETGYVLQRTAKDFADYAKRKNLTEEQANNEWNILCQERGLTAEAAIARIGLYGALSSLFSVQGAKIGEFRTQIKTNLGRAMHFIGEQTLIAMEVTYFAQLFMSEKDLKKPEELTAKILSTTITSSTISLTSRMSIDDTLKKFDGIKLPKVTRPSWLNWQTWISRLNFFQPQVAPRTQTPTPKQTSTPTATGEPAQTETTTTAPNSKTVVNPQPKPPKPPKIDLRITLSSLNEYYRNLIQQLLNGELTNISVSSLRTLLNKISSIDKNTKGDFTTYSFGNSKLSLHNTKEQQLSASNLNAAKKLLSEAIDISN
ncbi:MAG: hypothetical protein KBC84_02980 [Proteobacteria bacterium]|nr:hypothetical protein [Pseudomonadota bacterium]